MAPTKDKKKAKKLLQQEVEWQEKEQKRLEEEELAGRIEEDRLVAQRERIEALNAAALEAECRRLVAELASTKARREERQFALELETANLRKHQDWTRFVACDCQPDPKNESQLSSFLATWRHDVQLNMAEVLSSWEAAEAIGADILKLLCGAAKHSDTTLKRFCASYLRLFRDTAFAKLDTATGQFLRHVKTASANASANGACETQNSWTSQSKSIRIGVWGSLEPGLSTLVSSITHPELGIAIELPDFHVPYQANYCIGVRSVYTAFDWQSSSEDTLMISVGGLLTIQLFLFAQPPIKVDEWALRQLLPNGRSIELLSSSSSKEEGATLPTTDAIQPCKLEYTIPSYVILDDLKVSWWNAATESWSTEQIIGEKIDKYSRRVSFYSIRLTPFSLTQSRWLDLPYSWWHLNPTSLFSATLYLQTKRFQFQLQISQEGLQLIEPDMPELRHLYERVYEPLDLFLALRRLAFPLAPSDWRSRHFNVQGTCSLPAPCVD